MPFQEHYAFGPPADRYLAIWRYVDFARLLSLLQTKALYFARADTLGDAWEGSISAATFALLGDRTPRIARTFQLQTAVSCWHMNSHESVAMWDLYARAGTGLAIRSTVQRLIDSLANAAEEIVIAPISYIDYDTTPMRMDNTLYPLLHKRRSYAHEAELRAMTLFQPTSAVHDHATNPPGKLVATDVERLIEAVYVSPSAPTWLADTVVRVVRDTIGGQVPVRQSRLGEQPLF